MIYIIGAIFGLGIRVLSDYLGVSSADAWIFTGLGVLRSLIIILRSLIIKLQD